MLRVDLGQLQREGSVRVEARVPGEDDLWWDTGLVWIDDVEVRLTASYAGTGEVVVRGRIEGTLDQECRRCLKPVRTEFEEDVTIVFVSADDESSGEEAYVFDPTASELDLSRAVREELVLATSPYVVCDPDCKGLCARCGKNLNEGPCGCTENEIDPRWEALRGLKNE